MGVKFIKVLPGCVFLPVGKTGTQLRKPQNIRIFGQSVIRENRPEVRGSGILRVLDPS